MTTQTAYGTVARVDLVPIWCSGCGIPYGLPEGFLDHRRKDHKTWHCPNGCLRHYPPGVSDAEKLRQAGVRETALKDQLTAAIREGEAVRAQLLRDRQRFANGVCPCCNRSFPNVRDHMTTKHPDYDATKVSVANRQFRCMCGRAFATFKGLRTHQGKMRPGDWDDPKTPKTGIWHGSHLTKV